MKKLIAVLLVMIMAIAFGGCRDEQQEEPTTEAPATTEATTEEAIDYHIAYKKQVQNLIDEYGKFADGETLGTGVKYGTLKDMDGNGTPEMIIIHDMQVVIYTCDKEGNVESIYETGIGYRFGQGDTSYQVVFNDGGEKPLILVNKSENETSEEAFEVVTVNKGVAGVDTYRATTEMDIPDRELLDTFTINGTTVEQGEYEANYNSFMSGATIVDPYNNDEGMADYYDGQTYIAATPTEFEEFLASLDE